MIIFTIGLIVIISSIEWIQCRIKVGAIDATALGSPTQEIGPWTRKRSLLCFGCDFSGWYNFGKIIKLLPPDVTVR